VDHPANWRPQDSAVQGKYYDCLRDAQQGYATTSAGVAVSPYGGLMPADEVALPRTNYHMLKSCMQARGYEKREATTTEIFVGVVFSPIWVPLCTLAAIGSGNCFERQ